jgi:hypothetical protein
MTDTPESVGREPAQAKCALCGAFLVDRPPYKEVPECFCCGRAGTGFMYFIISHESMCADCYRHTAPTEVSGE